jgi:hypothetical protein
MKPAIRSLVCLGLLLAAAGLAAAMERIRVGDDGAKFVKEPSRAAFTPWGFNYDHDPAGRLIEDYWDAEWGVVEEDFREMRDLGANVVRVHLQTAKFVRSPTATDPAALAQLARLLRLAETNGLYLDLTGLGCYHKRDVPAWYDAMDEAGRWGVHELFWEAVATTCATSPAVFCYDLMNEPILPGAKPETNWLGGALGDKHFVQRITLDLAGRTREQVAKAWIGRLAGCIRKHDPRGLITVGVIPWALTFPGAKPVFYSREAGAPLDFTSVHFYPKKGEVAKALAALAVYDTGKPLVIEEMFPLACGIDELDAFIEGSRRIAEGWIGFYWGRTPEEYAAGKPDIAAAITKGWLDYFRRKGPALTGAAAVPR